MLPAATRYTLQAVDRTLLEYTLATTCRLAGQHRPEDERRVENCELGADGSTRGKQKV